MKRSFDLARLRRVNFFSRFFQATVSLLLLPLGESKSKDLWSEVLDFTYAIALIADVVQNHNV